MSDPVSAELSKASRELTAATIEFDATLELYKAACIRGDPVKAATASRAVVKALDARMGAIAKLFEQAEADAQANNLVRQIVADRVQ